MIKDSFKDKLKYCHCIIIYINKIQVHVFLVDNYYINQLTIVDYYNEVN